MAKKKWIEEAIKNPGSLHRSLRVPQGQKIPSSKIERASKAGGVMGRRARLAKTLATFKYGSAKR